MRKREEENRKKPTGPPKRVAQSVGAFKSSGGAIESASEPERYGASTVSAAYTRNDSAFAPVEHLKLVAGVGGEEPCDVAQTLGQGRSGQQRIFALAQVVVVEVNGQ